MFLPKYLKRPGNSVYDKGVDGGLAKKYSDDALFTAETDFKYEGYVKIENMRVKKIKKMEGMKIPYKFDYNLLSGLSMESREKLMRTLPETLGQASRIAGVRPSDVSILAVFLKSVF